MRKTEFGKRRLLTHLVLGCMTAALYLLIVLLAARGKQTNLLLILLGYLSLLLIGITLLIGPLNLWRIGRRRNPVNIYLRRDIGIWSAITGCWHTLLVLRGNVLNGQVAQFFLRRGSLGYALLLTTYGVSNDFGLGAILLLVLLLALSNTLSLRWLKGRRWKQLQRLSYLLILCAVAHTLGFQQLNLRGPFFVVPLIIFMALVLICQTLGIITTLFGNLLRP